MQVSEYDLFKVLRFLTFQEFTLPIRLIWDLNKGDKGKGFGLNSNDKSAEERLQKDLSRWSKISRNTAIRIYKHFFADFGKIKIIYVTQISLEYPKELQVSILNQALQCNPYQSLISKSMLF